MLGPLSGHLRDAAPELRLLLGWPGELPAVAATRTQDGWLANAAGETLARAGARARRSGQRQRSPGRRRRAALDRDVRGSQPRGRARHRARRDPGADGHRRHRRGDLGRRARLGRLGAARRAQRFPRTLPRPRSTGQRQGSLMAVGRDLVEPGSMADYESACRPRCARVRASRCATPCAHHESGRRWLMTRVEPAELGPQRGAFSVVTVDVTEEETARRRNQDLLTELTTILDVSPAGIAYLRGEELVRCNHRFEDAAGRHRLSGRQAVRRDPRQRRRARRDGRRADRRRARGRHAGDRVAAARRHASQAGDLVLARAAPHARDRARRDRHGGGAGRRDAHEVAAERARGAGARARADVQPVGRGHRLPARWPDRAREPGDGRPGRPVAGGLEGLADVAPVRERGGLAALRARGDARHGHARPLAAANARCGGATARCSGRR